MSAAAARRRKQKALKQQQQQQQQAASSSSSTATIISSTKEEIDPVIARLNELLSIEPCEESIAYEALQLAQSQVRRYVKLGQFDHATDLAYTTSMTLLDSNHKRVSVSSQLLTLLVQVLSETHTVCTDQWLVRMKDIDTAYQTALEASSSSSSSSNKGMNAGERNRLQRLHLQFLRRALRWSADLGTVKCGDFVLHELVGEQCWRMALTMSSSSSFDTETKDKNNDDDDDGNGGGSATTDQDEREDYEQQDEQDEDEEDFESSIAFKSDAVTHLSLAEKPTRIAELLQTLPKPSGEEVRMGHTCPPCERDALLTRSILVMVSMENLRDANWLLRKYMNDIEERNVATALTKSYMNKNDGVSPSHVMFNCMLLRIVEKDVKTGPLYSWLLRSFTNHELNKMYRPDVIKAYTTKIGRIYFNIQPPPSMLSVMENMMNMMSGAGGGAGAGGMGGFNPAMMQAMMGAGAGGAM